MSGLLDRVRAAGFSGELRAGEPLAAHCSLGVGGAAALFAVPRDEGELAALLGALRAAGAPWMVLGGGTNVLFPDRGYPGCVARLGEGFAGLARAGDGVEAGAALATPGLARETADLGLSGLEFAAGIPGTVGGALRMNAGSAGGDMAGCVSAVRVLGPEGAEWRSREALAFSYRNLVLPSDAVVTAARFALAPCDPAEARARLDALLDSRRASQPRERSAGCWFRNPPGDSAGRLIDAAGLKGARVGGALVSPVHANFLVRDGAASADDFRSLAQRVRDEVARRFGVMLEEEVHVIAG